MVSTSGRFHSQVIAGCHDAHWGGVVALRMGIMEVHSEMSSTFTFVVCGVLAQFLVLNLAALPCLQLLVLLPEGLVTVLPLDLQG